MPGADEDGSESTFNIDEARAGLTQLKEVHNVATVITLNGARDNQAYTNLLTELGLNQIAYTTAFPEADYLEGVTNRSQMTEAADQWSDPGFKSFVAEAAQAYNEGNTLIQCEHGVHRSLALNCIMRAIKNPTKTYEEVIASTCTTDEADEPEFLAYAGLIQYIAGNEALINELTSSVA